MKKFLAGTAIAFALLAGVSKADHHYIPTRPGHAFADMYVSQNSYAPTGTYVARDMYGTNDMYVSHDMYSSQDMYGQSQ